MKLLFYFFVLAVVALSCADNDLSDKYDGLYSGEFYRVRDGVKGETSYVTINIMDDKYNGSSTVVKYPAICKGTVAVRGNELEFTNGCMWTAEFDWTLILNGKFQASRDGEELILAKEIDSQNGDYYVLKRQ